MADEDHSPARAVERLVAIMARLRDPEHGCEWDRAQTFATVAPYTIEEAYEVADAIERGDWADLKDELGDLLLQVVFHSRIAEEAGLFALPDVVAAISDKMERRHPHIFGDAAETPGWGGDQGDRAYRQARRERAGRRRDRPPRPAPRREAAAPRGADRLRLARRKRPAREDRRGAGRGRNRRAGPTRGGGRRPALFRRQLGAPPRRRPGSGTTGGERQVRTPVQGDGGGGWRGVRRTDPGGKGNTLGAGQAIRCMNRS